MLVPEIKEKLIESKKFEVRDVEYKSEDDQKKYGLSFEAMSKKDFCYVEVNNLTLKARRIIEEFGHILFIHDGNQVEIVPEDISSLLIL